jgi:hypothetical protein
MIGLAVRSNQGVTCRRFAPAGDAQRSADRMSRSRRTMSCDEAAASQVEGYMAQIEVRSCGY